MVDTPSPSVQDSLNSLNTRMELNMVEVLAKSYGEGFVKAAEALDAKLQVTKDDSKILREDVARLTKPIQDYNKALAGKIDQIVRDSFAAGKDDLEVGRILRARIPEILNNEPITIQRPGKRPVSFTAEEYADMVSNVVPYAVRNEGYIRGLKDAGADGWQSVAVDDERMCPMCGAKHGQVYGWDDPKPPFHVSCRCRPVAYFRPKTKEELAESARIKAKMAEKPWETQDTPLPETADEVAEALIDDIIPKKMAYPGSKIERPKLESKAIDLTTSKAFALAKQNFDFELPIGNEDKYLKEMASEIGFNKPPVLVSKAELDKIIAEGHIPLARGVSKAEFADEFLTGDYFAGKGVNGNGIYVAAGEDRYKRSIAYLGEEGTLMNLALDNGAKIIDIEELKDLMESERSSLIRSLRTAKADEKESLTVMRHFLADPGRFAMARGYDAVKVYDDYLILNRNALYAQKTTLRKEEVKKLILP